MTKNFAIILASGSSERLKNLQTVKQFTKIAGKTVIEHTLNVFERNKNIDEIVIVTRKDYIDFCKGLIQKNNFKKITKVIEGGNTRQESSSIAVNSLDGNDNDNVLIHDAVRPFITDLIIDNCIQALQKYKAVDVAIESADTIIQVDEKNVIDNIPKRKFLRRGQTPQAFKLGLIKEAHKLAKTCKSLEVTDDCGIIKHFNLAEIYVVNGDDFNIKITYPLDIDIADKLFQIRTFDVPKTDLTQLKNKVLVIFGASRGIGECIFKMAKKHNAKVYGFSKQDNVDISNHNCVKKTLEAVYNKEQKIDYIINTAGILKISKLEDMNYADMEQEVATNYIGSINVLKEAIPYLKKTNGAVLLFTSSSYTRGRENYSIYSSSKAAVVNLVQAVAQEHIKDNVRINVINPERTATPMRFENFGKEDKSTLLKPESVAIASLSTILSDLSGQVINVTLAKEREIEQLL